MENVVLSKAQPSFAESSTKFADPSTKKEADSSGVSWAAVIAGAFVAAALSLSLLALGAGLGLSSISPWSNVGASTVSKAAIVWLILVQIIASALGGYLAGRLRTKWVNVHTDEVYFRDTAHGFLVWAVSLVMAAAFLASAATSLVGGPAMIGDPGTAMGTRGEGRTSDSTEYFVDSLFRSDHAGPDRNDSPMRTEVELILANAIRQRGVPAADKTYLAQLVAARTGISQAEAEKRVSDVFAEARQAADTARKAVAHALYWLFLALLIGAFCASFAATLGGRQRDHLIA
jgi:hypothetical protein